MTTNIKEIYILKSYDERKFWRKTEGGHWQIVFNPDYATKFDNKVDIEIAIAELRELNVGASAQVYIRRGGGR